jgi:hypothetical protein
MIGMSVHIRASKISLLFDEIILLRETHSTLLANLLLAELRIVIVFFAHAIQVMLHHLFLSANFLNSCHLLIAEVSVAISKLLLFLLTTLTSFLFVLLLLLDAILLLTAPLQHLIVVSVLEFLQLASLFTRLLDLFDRTNLFVLEHANAIAKLLNVSLELKSDRASLIVSEILALNIDNNVGTHLAWCTVSSVAHHSAVVALLSERMAIAGAGLADRASALDVTLR